MDAHRDLSWHKNTRQATSYFAFASDDNFFGGYDHSKKCGVVLKMEFERLKSF